MKKLVSNLALLIMLTVVTVSFGQNKRSLNNYREPSKEGINVFEAPKDTAVIKEFDGVKVRIGGASALQFQSIEHENSNPLVVVDGEDTFPYKLKEIGGNFNLATANLDLDVQLHDGLRMHLRTYLSSRHHPEPYVKGGYLQIDNLNFISEGLMAETMKYVTLKLGHMENNYGDGHFRRSDNAQALYNPFVGNLIMDAFTTEVGAEIYYRRDGFIGMLGFTNGKLNQNINKSPEDEWNKGTTGGASFLAKLGYDKQINDDLRFRITGSLYTTGDVTTAYLYSADRTGSRYYGVMILDGADDNFRSGRYNPNLKNQITAIMVNPFVKYQGLEFFGTIEMASGRADNELNGNGEPADDRKVTQFAGELIYRFGETENFYIGARYNVVSAEDKDAKDWDPDDYTKINISRFQASAGWFLTKNVMAKLEYVSQSYNDYADLNAFNDGKFNGIVFESVISF